MANEKHRIGLIYPHQLFEKHPVLGAVDHCYVVSEKLIIGGDDEWPLKPHAKKLLLHLATMRSYADQHDLERADSLSDIDLSGCSELVVSSSITPPSHRC